MKTPFTLLFICISMYIDAQTVSIGTTSPNVNAALDITNTSKGLLIPRMDSTHRKNMPSVKGMLVFDSTYNSIFYNNGIIWMNSGLPGGAAGGDLSGSYPNPTVSNIQGVAINSSAPVANQVLTANSGTTAQWKTILNSVGIYDYSTNSIPVPPGGAIYFANTGLTYGGGVYNSGPYLTIQESGLYSINYNIYSRSSSGNYAIAINGIVQAGSGYKITDNTLGHGQFLVNLLAGQQVSIINNGVTTALIGTNTGAQDVAASILLQKTQ